MERKIYLSDDVLSLSEYIDSEDDLNCYQYAVFSRTRRVIKAKSIT